MLPSISSTWFLGICVGVAGLRFLRSNSKKKRRCRSQKRVLNTKKVEVCTKCARISHSEFRRVFSSINPETTRLKLNLQLVLSRKNVLMKKDGPDMRHVFCCLSHITSPNENVLRIFVFVIRHPFLSFQPLQPSCPSSPPQIKMTTRIKTTTQAPQFYNAFFKHHSSGKVENRLSSVFVTS